MTLCFESKIEYGTETFTYAYPIKNLGGVQENHKTAGSVTTSITGVQQTIIHYQEALVSLVFERLSPLELEEFREFYLLHASRGLEFTVYQNLADPLPETYTLQDGGRSLQVKFNGWQNSESATYELVQAWEVILKCRRVL